MYKEGKESREIKRDDRKKEKKKKLVVVDLCVIIFSEQFKQIVFSSRKLEFSSRRAYFE
jgi:hypothetical protein